jgi:phage-related protein
VFEKPIKWVGSSLEDLKSFPTEVQRSVGFALSFAQMGTKHMSAKPLKGKEFKGASTLEVVENYDGNTYRAVYTVKVKDLIYVLHCFQKKSKTGISTPKPDMDLIRRRLKEALDGDEND